MFGRQCTASSFSVFLTGLMLLAATPVVAASFDETWNKQGAQTCFSRHYDRKYLASHPRQRLTSFALSPSPPGTLTKPDNFEVSFSFTLKGIHDEYGGAATCHHTRDNVECWADADGGSFTMRADGSSLLLEIARLEVEGERGFNPDLAVGGDDRVVRLFASPTASCSD